MKDKLKKYLLPNLPYLFFVYLFDIMQMHSSYVITDPKGYNNIGQRKSHTVRRKSSAMWLFLYPI